jgi:adenylate cyclase
MRRLRDVDELEALLLGAAPYLTREDVEARTGVPTSVAVEIWSAMGFAEVPAGVVAFTDRDVEALRTAASLLELGVLDADTLRVMARAMGQEMARLAEGQIDVFRAMSADMSVEQALDMMAAMGEQVLPRLDHLVLFVWRRQFAAAAQRSLATVREDGMPVLAIGFLDLADFTRSSREWDAGTLARTLERFEHETALRVAAVGGRVVKTLGDGVLFTTDTAEQAVQVALDTVDAHSRDPHLPGVRGGVATGPVLVRLGDVFGEPVNIASRLSDQARPGSVLIDRAAALALAGRPFDVRPLQRRSVRGYRSLLPYLVRVASAGQDAPAGPG